MERINRLKTLLLQSNIDGALISKKESIFYLCGLQATHPTEREAFLLITPHQTVLYHTPFVSPPPNPQITTIAMSIAQPLLNVLQQTFPPSIVNLGIETTNLTVAELERTNNYIPGKHIQAIDSLVETMRQTKDADEQRSLLKAGRIAAKTMRWIHQFISREEAVGLTEIDVAQTIDHHMLLLGATRPAFPTIVAFDQNSAFPHHIPNKTRLKPNSIVLIDMGAQVNHYNSDLTRTWQRQNAEPKFKQIKHIVDRAYHRAITLLKTKNTMAANVVDYTARECINQAGYANNFIHSTGHGIGLEAHEAPHINSTDSTPLTCGTAFTIEPGIYLNGQFGYRHENTFILTPKGLVQTTR